MAKKFEQVNKTAKQAEGVDRMSKSLERIKSQMQAIEKFDLAKKGFLGARDDLRRAQEAVERFNKSVAGMASPNMRAVTAEQNRLAAAVTRTSRVYDQQRSAVLSAKRELESTGGAIGNAVSQQHRLAAAVERTSAAMRRQARWTERRREAGILGTYAAVAAGHKAAHGARATFETYREFDKERRFGKAVMGLTDQQQVPLVNQAIHLGATTKFNDIQVLEAQRELAARGLNIGQVMGVIGPAADLGQALDLRLPDATRQLEGALFGFKRDMSSTEAATSSARRTADMQTKAAKVSGMKPEDLTQLYKYGATPARMGGMSEEALLAFGGVLKKANIGGDEGGVAFRALMAAAQSPTRKAREALLANGLNFKDYQKNPDRLALAPFVENIAAQYGVKLNKKAQSGLGAIFENKELISDLSKFTPAVMQFLKGNLGGRDAKSLRSIAGAANRYRDASMKGIDTDSFVADLMTKVGGNLQFANAIFGSKQGGRIATALGDPATFKHMLDEIRSNSEGYAGAISAERMAGFDGAVSRFEGATKNLETAIGRAFDKDGSGGPLTAVTDAAGKLVQGMAELNSKVLAVGASITALGAGFFALRGIVNISKLLFGGGGLTASAVALNESAAALTAAAVRLGGAGAVATGAKAAAGGAAAAAASPWAARFATAVPFLGPTGLALGGAAAIYGLRQYVEGEGYAGKTVQERLDMQGGGSMRDVRIRAFNEERERMGLPLLGGGRTVEAELKGRAEVTGKAEVTINIPSLGVHSVTVPLRGALNANGPGSLGVSSPDAAAAPVGTR